VTRVGRLRFVGTKFQSNQPETASEYAVGIVPHEPESTRETARLVDRDVNQVHRNLKELEELHLVVLVDDGQSKQPSVWYDTIDIDLPLVAPDVASDEATA